MSNNTKQTGSNHTKQEQPGQGRRADQQNKQRGQSGEGSDGNNETKGANQSGKHSSNKQKQ